jgi:hypothetical protein
MEQLKPMIKKIVEGKECDDYIVFKNQKIKTFKRSMIFLAPKFVSGYEVRADVKLESLLEFLKPSQALDMEKTSENIFDLDLLCTEAEAENLHEEISDYIKSKGTELLIPHIQFLLDHDEQPTESEELLKTDFPKYATDTRLLDLPVDCLARVIRFPSSTETADFDKVFNFLLRLYEKYDTEPKISLEGLDLSNLTKEQIEALRSHPRLAVAYVSQTPVDIFLGFLDKIVDLKQRCNGLSPGIIASLTAKHGGNVHDLGIVSIRATSNTENAKAAADVTANNIFQSGGESNPEITYDFKNMKVSPTHYLLRSHPSYGENSHHPKQWHVDGSLDGSNWVLLDSRQNCNKLNGQNFTRKFSIGRVGEWRFIRFQMTNTNWAGSWNLYLAAFEIFGTLIE